MPTLSEEVAARKKAVTPAQDPQRTPEMDAKIDAFIKENPELFNQINGHSKEYLVRQRMVGMMESRDYRKARNEEVLEWVEQNPDIKTRVASRVRHVPEDKRQRAFLNAAKDELQREGMRPPRPY